MSKFIDSITELMKESVKKDAQRAELRTEYSDKKSRDDIHRIAEYSTGFCVQIWALIIDARAIKNRLNLIAVILSLILVAIVWR